jgi:outer membrane protein TolC
VKQSELELNKQRLRNGRHLSGMAFCQLLGIPYDPNMELSDSMQPTVEPQQYYVDNEQALKNRAEFELLQYGIRAEKLQTSIKRGEYLPEVGVGASFFHLNAMDNGGVNNVAVFCSISIPVSGWWEASHILKEKKIKEKIAENRLKDTSELLLLQMQKAWYELTETYTEISLAEELVRQAEENLKVSQDGYRQGVVNITDLLDAQALYQQARVQNIDARANNRVKLIHYLQVTGRYESH